MIKRNQKPVWDQFESRITSPARAKMCLPYHPVSKEDLHDEIIQLFSMTSSPRPTALYIHIPFCSQNCSFCGYYKIHNFKNELVSKYISKIKQELYLLSKHPRISAAKIEAIYFGGGTPSILPYHLLDDLTSTIYNYFKLDDSVEITIESPLHNVSYESVKQMIDLGINRISLGVQTFQTEIRQRLGRVSDRQEIIKKINLIDQAGIRNICIDLIYGLPGQNLSNWQDDLSLAVSLPITGYSVYPLIPFPNATLARSGASKPLSNQQAYQYFKLADEVILDQHGWRAFSPVQYGHHSLGTAKYISLTGLQGDLLAVGPSAGGHILNYQYLSKFAIQDTLDDDYNFMWNSQWFKAPSEIIPMLELFKLSEGGGLTIKALDQFSGGLNGLFKQEQINTLFTAENGILQLSQAGRFWAGNLSRQISDSIIKIANFKLP